jgi:hypothetical protein
LINLLGNDNEKEKKKKRAKPQNISKNWGYTVRILEARPLPAPYWTPPMQRRINE